MRKRHYMPILAAAFAIILLAALLWEAGTPGSGSALPVVSAAEEDALDQAIFPKDKVVDVKITVAEADFQDMLANASAEEMKPASVEYNGVKLDNVGIRTKGNLSLSSVVNSDSDRYSFKLSFDEYIANQNLYGISKINLNNNYSDATSMREFLTYELAEQMGLPTPKFSYVNVYVNGELWGFYLAIEQVGDAYLDRNFGNAYGALYKAEFGGGFGGGGRGGNAAGGGERMSGGGDLVWQGDDLDSYPSLVQKSKKSNDGILIDMLNELNNGSDYEKVLDVNNVLKYIALNAVTVNMDSYLGSNQQNYYLYEDDGIFSVLPWDYNMSFNGMAGMGRMGGGEGGGSEQIMIDEPTQGALADRPLAAKLLAVDEYKEQYHDIIRSMIEGYLSDEAFAKRVSELKELISPYVQQDPRAFYTYEEFQSAVPELLSFTQDRVANVAGQLDGTIASSGDGSGSGGGFGGMGGMGWQQRPGQGQGPNQGQRPGQGQRNEQTTWERTESAAISSQAVLDAATTPNAQDGQGGMTPPDGQMPNGQGGMTPPDGNGQGGMTPPDGQMPNGQGGMTPPNFGQSGGFGGGFPGGGFGGMPGGTAADQTETGYRNAAVTGIALISLLLVGLFVTLYKRRRL